jgi:cysteinyl-tRNA synthetase
MNIFLYNTKTKSKELFRPIHENEVRMYHCGPTVYNYAHIGNLRAYVFADTLRRMFEWNEYRVKQVINITDVGHLVSDGDDGEDKMQKGARREGKTAWDVAKFYEAEYKKDLEALNIRTQNTHFPRATEFIQEQIALVKQLEDKGYTYKTPDGIYFDTSKFEHYTDFAKLDVKGMQEGARVEVNNEKRNSTDFALWKFSPSSEKRDMEWESPWGVGFPGWHIECSAMSEKILETPFDIHTGGIDHIPVHHTNEIAQSECASGHKYVHYWMHVNFLNIKDGKMAKSGENFIRLQTLIDRSISPLAYRYWLLTSHYRSAIDFSFEAVEAAQTALNRLYDTYLSLGTISGEINTTVIEKCRESINDDLNTAQVIAQVWEYVKSGDTNENKKATLDELDTILGLQLSTQKKEVIPEDVTALAEARLLARINKNWKESDRLRAEIEAKGFSVKDTGDSYKIKKG